MKTIMRLAPTQVPSVVKHTTPGNAIFDRDLAVMAGYRYFDIMLVGGSGGKCGKAVTDTNNVAGYQGISYPCGGGGGGSLRLRGAITSLPNRFAPIVVGASGAAGADGAKDGPAGNGTDGGTSSFETWSAFGGKGAVGGNYNSTIRTQPNVNTDIIDVTTRPKGGDGGSNSSNHGTGGVAGQAAMYEINSAGTITDTAATAATAGTWVWDGTGGKLGVSPVAGGGKGGGGGPGRVDDVGSKFSAAQQGQYGSAGGGEDHRAMYGPAGTTDGGGGGGANIGPVTGTTESYGCNAVVPETRFPQGAVAIRLNTDWIEVGEI